MLDLSVCVSGCYCSVIVADFQSLGVRTSARESPSAVFGDGRSTNWIPILRQRTAVTALQSTARLLLQTQRVCANSQRMRIYRFAAVHDADAWTQCIVVSEL